MHRQAHILVATALATLLASTDAPAGSSRDAPQPEPGGSAPGEPSPGEAARAGLRFVSYGAIPTWSGVVTGWRGTAPAVHLYDTTRYRGHADFVSRGLGTGFDFRTFKARVRDPASRDYLPIFVYDLRDRPHRLKGQAWRWAVRLEDYSYRDGDDGMATLLVRLRELVATQVPELGPDGMVVLATSPAVRPNRAIAPALAAAGIATLAIPELVRGRGGEPIEVLNPGKAIGRLRRWNPERPHAVGPDDVVVFREIPKRVPPVAGIITLQPQTPLSHVNLLARNRGTPNLYTDRLDRIPGAAELVGDLVQLEARERRITLRRATEDEAARWREARRREGLSVPRPRRDLAGTLALASASPEQASVARVGAKAANYALIEQALGPRVRPGHALGFDAYYRTVEGSPAAARIEELLSRRARLRPEAVRALLAVVRGTIERATVPADVIASVRALCDGPYATRRIRLRSSTNAEDLPQFNGAGLYTSKGFNCWHDDERLAQKLGVVFASLWSDTAFAERELFGIDHRDVGMAILVNEAFELELANGVALTLPPTRPGQPLALLVNAQSGEAAVTNPDPGDVPEAYRFTLGEPPAGMLLTRSSLLDVFVGHPEIRPLLDELVDDVRTVHTLLTGRQARRGDGSPYGVDLEFKLMWKADGAELFIKQARLIGAVLPE